MMDGGQLQVSYDDWRGQAGEDLCAKCHHARKNHLSRRGITLCEVCRDTDMPDATHAFSLGVDKGPVASSEWAGKPTKKPKKTVKIKRKGWLSRLIR